MFGFHVNRNWCGNGASLEEHLEAARAHAREAGVALRAFQVFVAGPQQRKFNLSGDGARAFRAYLDESRPGARPWVVAHGTYMDAPWSGKPHPIKFIRQELELCAKAGVRGVVVHLGRPSPDVVLAQLPKLLRPLAFEEERGQENAGELRPSAAPPRLYLEVPHVKPANSHYETPEKLEALFRRIRDEADPELERVGLCIDTAHLWSCGVDIASREAAEQWIEEFEAVHETIPPGAVLLHINDSFDERGSGVDHHAPLLAGRMWSDYADTPRESGLAPFLEYAARHGVPAVLERKDPREGVRHERDVLLKDYEVLTNILPQLEL
jgi:endonuclease IV